jgi:riboflavin kinase/FMN adenylyltransferase
MKVLDSLEQLPSPPAGAILTIGNFDGVHRGHQKLFSRVVQEARRIQGTAALITFQPHPAKLLRPELAPRLLTTREQKLAMVEAAGMDLVMNLHFTPDLCRTPATEFVQSLVVPHFQPRTIFIGTPFRFGHNREGDVGLLRSLGGRLGFRAEGVGVVDEDGETISATRIRHALREGRAAAAARMLGRPYEVVGTVVEGAGRGRELQFPTANLACENELIPRQGVYATWLRLDDDLLPSVTNIGQRPTFDEAGLAVEAHVLDFDGDLYHRRVGLQFVQRLREERRFDSPEELVAQIRLDVARSSEILVSAP